MTSRRTAASRSIGAVAERAEIHFVTDAGHQTDFRRLVTGAGHRRGRHVPQISLVTAGGRHMDFRRLVTILIRHNESAF